MRPRILPPSILLVTCVLLAAVPSVPAQEGPRAPITHEDVWLMKRLGAPALSPDGRWAVVSVTEPAYDEKQQVSDLWIVPTDGSEPPRRLTSTPGSENGVTWSPDGSRIAFTARREGDEVPQVYLLEHRGGEAQRLTTLSTGARAPRWKPDGSAILFVSDVYPGAKTDEENKAAAAERKARKTSARVYDSFPIRDWDRWRDERRPSLFVQPVAAGSRATDLLAGTALAAQPGFGGQGGSGIESLAAVWTPDGEGIVFVATTNRHEAAFTEVVQSLWLLPAGGGEPTRLTTDRASYGSPAFGPDGRTLYALRQPFTDKVHNDARLVAWDWPVAGPMRVLTAGFDRGVGSFDLAPDGRRVYLLAEDEGFEKLYEVSRAGGPVREVGRTTAGVITDLAVGGTANAPVLVAKWESAVVPPEVVRLDPSTGARTPLTRFNVERAARIDWRPLESFWFTSSRGARVHSFLVYPPAFDPAKKYPVFTVIHGGPHTMWRDQFVIRWNYHLLAAPGYVVLLTNYTGSTGFGEAFAQGIQGDPLEGPALEINEAVDEAIRRFPFIDATRQVAGGASYGGHLTNWLAVTTTRYRALVSHAGLFDLDQQWGTSDTIYFRERNSGGPPWEGSPVWTQQTPLLRAGNLRTPMLVTVGELDYRVPVNNAIQTFSALQRMKVPSRLIVFPDENHWVLKGENSRFFYREVHGWIARWLDATPESAGR